MAEEMQTTMGRDAPEGGGNGLLGALLSNPAMLGSLLSGLTANGGAETAPSATAARESDEGGETVAASADVGRAMSDGIGAVLSDPQMLAKLPEMMQMLKPLMGAMSVPTGGGGDGGEKRESVAAGAKPSGKAGEEHAVSGKGGRCHDRRIALLKALRPYMNCRRQEVIDYILRMDKMGSLFRNS